MLLQATPAAPANVSQDVIEALTKRTQDGGTEVVNAKAGKVGFDLSLQQVLLLAQHHAQLQSALLSAFSKSWAGGDVAARPADSNS